MRPVPDQRQTRQQRSTLLRQSLWLLGFDGEPPTGNADNLSAFIGHHGVAGILDADRLAQAPVPVYEALKAGQLLTVAGSLRLSVTLARVSTCFGDSGIRHLAIKGPALAQQVYGRTSARTGVDLDILVPADCWPDAVTELTHMGYRPADDQAMTLAPGTHELVFIHDTLARVELHRRLLRRRHEGLTEWSAGQIDRVDVHGVSVPTLSPAAALPYLAAHAGQHLFRRLIWLVDILALLRHPAFDPEQAAWLSRRADLSGVVGACVALLQNLFATELPDSLQRLQSRSWAESAMLRHAGDAILDCEGDYEIARRIGVARRVAMDIGLEQTTRARLRALGDWLSPTARDEAWLALPQNLRILYPVVRLARILARGR